MSNTAKLGEDNPKYSACFDFVMFNVTEKGPVCRQKLVLLYLCMLLLAESYAPEPNSGPRPPKFPCGVCHKAVKWSTSGVQCDSCKIWYHQDCMGMSDNT